MSDFCFMSFTKMRVKVNVYWLIGLRFLSLSLSLFAETMKSVVNLYSISVKQRSLKFRTLTLISLHHPFFFSIMTSAILRLWYQNGITWNSETFSSNDDITGVYALWYLVKATYLQYD